MIADLIAKLHDKRSWCGETHVQKTAYLTQELLGVPLGFKFILYRHGAYSFDLHEAIGAMRAYRFLGIEVPPPPYGPSLVLTPRGEKLRNHFQKSNGRFAKQTDWVAERLGDKNVVQLEKLSTAYYVTREKEMEKKSVDVRARRLHELKPHISTIEAARALHDIDAMIEEAPSRA